MHASKKGTPVVGGFAFSLGALATAAITTDMTDPMIFLPLLSMMLFLFAGYLDDRMKRRTHNGDGFSSKAKFLLQLLCSSIVLLVAFLYGALQTSFTIFSVKIELGPIYPFAAVLYLLYFVNAVNITDGLDGLASGASIPILLLILFLSQRLGKNVSSAMVGALLAFLYFNRPPARYFMGDAGSHALGAYIGVSALLLKAELVFLIASGLFLLELSSSLIQIISIRRFGRKVFAIAPLHHAYEQKGVKEHVIVGFFIGTSWCFAAVGLLLSR